MSHTVCSNRDEKGEQSQAITSQGRDDEEFYAKGYYREDSRTSAAGSVGKQEGISILIFVVIL